jgi:hypothetical protein
MNGPLGQSSLGQSGTFSHRIKKDNTTSYGGGAGLGGDQSFRKNLCGIGSRSSDSKLALESWTRKVGSST